MLLRRVAFLRGEEVAEDYKYELQMEQYREQLGNQILLNAAILIQQGNGEQVSVDKVKEVMQLREEYRDNPSAHIEGEGADPDVWLLAECKLPAKPEGDQANRQVHAIYQRLLAKRDSFDV
ncbi:hypothetical protein APB70_10605 [Pseudomonas aeruginosa]|uniref:Uncharacterized protein n=1 Tax=Pseudomonas aeruginosa TaxID=287 RepID=A0A9P1VZS8_PSEAI|nr:hypothetical protein G039_0333425 [Pseudomonas aeruginosa VRFPA01]KSE27393.1 hypothetical protein AO907_07770 [Pseudomonas aeruginosa]SCZ06435.1 Uncharacterised protein [Acinetobacter baumannii]KFF32830.1 hypothetical protein G039_0328430 [Pseudomonas aeruginosa VRFPA01]KSO97652.1 hypothetical protein APB03_10985 [Pseudomonas aeruginosa]